VAFSAPLPDDLSSVLIELRSDQDSLQDANE
jgi:hypothetical protein